MKVGEPLNRGPSGEVGPVPERTALVVRIEIVNTFRAPGAEDELVAQQIGEERCGAAPLSSDDQEIGEDALFGIGSTDG